MHSYTWNFEHHDVEVPPFKSSYNVKGVLPLFFMEHCVECAMPLCYKTCPMYENRRDKRCRRFDFGQQRVTFNDSILDGATCSFRKWAKLGAFITHKLEAVDVNKIHRLERFINNTSVALEFVCHAINWQPYRPSRVFVDAIDRLLFQKRDIYKHTMPLDGFLATIYNHECEDKTVFIELVKSAQSLFRASVKLHPGWNEWFKPMNEIPLTNEHGTMINIYFEGEDKGMLTFKYFDFVALKQEEKKEIVKPATKVKCVAWDLDNTMWNGVIGDDGPDGVTVKDSSVSLVKQLDAMGVLNTVVSKNNFDVAWNKLIEIGIDKYFLYPAINWGRKSQSLIAIANKININLDTFAVIDDSPFERNEICSALPQVRVFDVTDVPSLLDRPEFDIPVTEESKKRRETYQTESKRNDIFASWSGNYDDFLRDCGLLMEIFIPQREEDVKRCLELMQRSNQYNVSGVKRDKDYMNMVLHSKGFSSFGYRVEDRYGKYGIVGFASFKGIGVNEFLLTDFVMSCRIAQKKVERAFFNFFIRQLPMGSTLRIHVNKTNRNMPLQDELIKMPFTLDSNNDSELCLHYVKSAQDFCNDEIIKVIFRNNSNESNTSCR